MPKLRLVLSGVIYTLLLLAVYVGYLLLRQPDFLPVRQIEVSRQLQHVRSADVLSVAHRELWGNFFTADITHLRRSLEQLPWVRQVLVQRSFPDKVSIVLEEYQVLARWKTGMLISPDGEVFSVPDAHKLDLPLLSAPDGMEKMVVSNFVQFDQALAKIGLHVKQLSVSSRRAWQLRLDNDIVLELGRDNMKMRLQRFITVYPEHLAASKEKIRQVDLRYRNGFAVQP